MPQTASIVYARTLCTGTLCAVLIVAAGCRGTRPTELTTTYTNPISPEYAMDAILPVSLEEASQTGSIEDFVQMGLSRSPRIQEAQFKIEALREQIPQVLALPDPMVTSTTHLSPVQTAAGEQAFGLGVNQKFTNYERRTTKAAMVSDEIAVAVLDMHSIELEIAEQIRRVCQQLLLIQKSILITEEDARSLQRIAELIEEQFSVKKSVTQQDVLNVQMEQATIANELTRMREKESSYNSRLARLMHLKPSTKLTLAAELVTEDHQFDVNDLIAQASENPELKSQIARIQKNQKNIRLSELAGRPDFTVGLNWIATSSSGISPVANGDDAVLLGVGFNLPIYQDRIRAGVAEAQWNRRASESKLASLSDEIAEEVYVLVDKIENTKQMLGLLQGDIIPKANRTLELSISEYSTGKADFVQLIENWRSVLRYKLSEANLQSQHNQALASLTRAVGHWNLSETKPNPADASPSETTSRVVNQDNKAK